MQLRPSLRTSLSAALMAHPGLCTFDAAFAYFPFIVFSLFSRINPAPDIFIPVPTTT